MSTTLQRKTPLRKKAAKPRRKLIPRCTKLRCDRYELADGLCFQHIVKLLDVIVREQCYEAWVNTCAACGGNGDGRPLEWSHHLSRRFMAIRWEPSNFVAHCSECHTRFTHHPHLHTEWIVRHAGEKVYGELMDAAYGPIDPNTGRRTGPPKFGNAELLEWYEQLKAAA